MAYTVQRWLANAMRCGLFAVACLVAACGKPPEPEASAPARATPPIEQIGSVDTPASLSTQAWNDATIAIAIFEQLGKQTEINLIERRSGVVRSVTLPESYIVYSMEFDRANPAILWVATSQAAQVFRVDTSKLTYERVAKLDADKFIFGLGLGASGDVYFGTYPDGKLYTIGNKEGTWSVREIKIDAVLVGGRTNVQTVLANDTGQIFFQIGSPGRLIGYDEKTGKLAALLDTPDSFFFPARDFPETIKQIDGPEDLRLYPLTYPATPGELPERLRKLLPRVVFDLKEDKFQMIVEHDGRKTVLDTHPKQGGMPIVAFKQVKPGLVLGGTYWNRWAFEFDLENEAIRSLDVIGRTGEFFAACGDDTGVFIPHYLGTLLEYAPGAPLDRADVVPPGSDPRAVSPDPKDNPKEVLVIPDGHLALSCVVTNRTLYYAMLPNYGQQAGLIAKVTDGKLATVASPKQTYGQLTSVASAAGSPARLFAATSDFIGLGLKRTGESPPMRLVELDPDTLQETRSVDIPLDRYRNAVGLVHVGNSRLVLGTEGGGLFEIDFSKPQLEVTHVGDACVGASSLSVWRDGFVAVICASRLFIYSLESQGLALAIELPEASSFVAASKSGNVYTTSRSDIFRVSADTVSAAADRAVRTPSGDVISSPPLDPYVASHAQRRDQAGWIGAASGATVSDGGSWVGFDYGQDRPLTAREVDIVWITKDTTPPQVAIESSHDGLAWKRVAIFDSSPSPEGQPYWDQTVNFENKNGAARYWRLTPVAPYAGQFGVEFVELRS